MYCRFSESARLHGSPPFFSQFPFPDISCFFYETVASLLLEGHLFLWGACTYHGTPPPGTPFVLRSFAFVQSPPLLRASPPSSGFSQAPPCSKDFQRVARASSTTFFGRSPYISEQAKKIRDLTIMFVLLWSFAAQRTESGGFLLPSSSDGFFLFIFSSFISLFSCCEWLFVDVFSAEEQARLTGFSPVPSFSFRSLSLPRIFSRVILVYSPFPGY